MKKKMMIAAGAVVLAICAAIAYGAATGMIGREKPVEVSAAEATVKAIGSSIYTSGKVVPRDERRVFASGVGKVVSVRVSEGAKVKKNQVLAVMDTTDLRLQLSQQRIVLASDRATLDDLVNGGRKKFDIQLRDAKLAMESAMTTYETNLELFENDVIAESELKASETAYEKAANAYDTVKRSYDGVVNETQAELQRKKIESTQLSIQRLEKSISDAYVKSPISGTVTSAAVKAGDMPSAAQPLFIVKDLSALKVETDVSEYDIAKVRVGQKVVIGTDGSDKEYGGRVTAMSPTGASRVSGTTSETVVKTTISILGRAAPLKPDFNVRLTIFTGSSEKVLSVPIEAVVERDDATKYVFVLTEGGSVVEVNVETGKMGDTLIEIKAGISEGDSIVVGPPDGLKAGSPVTVVEGS